MSARNELLSFVQSWHSRLVEIGMPYPLTPDQMIDGYRDEVLSEAAERIRQFEPGPIVWDDDYYRGLEAAADLIDPDVGARE